MHCGKTRQETGRIPGSSLEESQPRWESPMEKPAGAVLFKIELSNVVAFAASRRKFRYGAQKNFKMSCYAPGELLQTGVIL